MYIYICTYIYIYTHLHTYMITGEGHTIFYVYPSLHTHTYIYIYIYLEWIYILDIYPCITTNSLRHMVLYPSNTSVYIYIYILVGGLEHDFYFPNQLGMSSSQLTFIFFRGVEATNQYIYIYIYIYIHREHRWVSNGNPMINQSMVY